MNRKSMAQVARMIDAKMRGYPTTGLVMIVDGNLADIRLPGRTTNISNCRIVGDPTEISVGMTVDIRWDDYHGTKRPVIMGGGASGTGLSASGLTTVITDNVTIEYSDDGLRVKPGGIGLNHLNFVPAMADHEHDIGDFLSGWAVTDDGVLWNQDVSINPLGEITLGRDPDIVKLSTQDSTYRIWAGALAPASAPFSVSKTGHLISSSATIAGWEITATEIKKTGIILDSSVPRITVGSGDDEIFIDGTEKMVRSKNFDAGVSGFGLYATDGDAEFNNVVVRGSLRASVFTIGELTATAGSMGVFKSAAELYENVTIPATNSSVTIKAKNSDENTGAALFSQYDVLRIKAWNGTVLTDTWLSIKVVTPNTNYSSYSCIINSGGSVNLKKGTAIVDYGKSGDGFVIQSADNTVGASANISIGDFITGVVTLISWGTGGSGYTVNDIVTVVEAGASGCTLKVLAVDGGGSILETGGFQLTPVTGGQGYGYASGERWITGGTGTQARVGLTTWTGPWGATQTLRVRIGNMYGSFGAGSNKRYGIGIGNYDSGNYMSYNAEGEGEFVVSGSDGTVTLNENGIRARNAAKTAVTVKLDADGDAFFGSNVGFAATTALAIFANAQSYGSPTESMGAGDVLFGDNSTSKANIMWDHSAGILRFRSGKITEAYVNTDGAIMAGGGLVKIDSDGIVIQDDATSVSQISWWYSSSGSKYIGSVYGDYGGGGDAIMWLRAYKQTGDPWTAPGVILAAIDDTTGKDVRLWVDASGIITLSEAAVNITGGNLSVTNGFGLFSNDVFSGGGGQFRGTLTGAGGSGGVELEWISTYGNIQSYNRSGTSYQPLRFTGSQFDWYEGTTKILTANAGDLYTEPWAAYTPSRTGWASYTETTFWRKTQGDTVMVICRCAGTSNLATTTFTLPYPRPNNANNMVVTLVVNDGTNGRSIGYISCPQNSSVCSVYPTAAGGGWRTTGTKAIWGTFTYQRA